MKYIILLHVSKSIYKYYHTARILFQLGFSIITCKCHFLQSKMFILTCGILSHKCIIINLVIPQLLGLFLTFLFYNQHFNEYPCKCLLVDIGKNFSRSYT